jgi:hypothetical protein
MFRNKKDLSDASLASVVNQFEFECQPNQLHHVDTAYLPDEDLMTTIKHLHEYVTHPDYAGKEYQMHVELHLPESLIGFKEFEYNLSEHMLLINQWNKRIKIYDKEIAPYLTDNIVAVDLPFLKQYPELSAWYGEFDENTTGRIAAFIAITLAEDAPQGPLFFTPQALPRLNFPEHPVVDYLLSFPNFLTHSFDFLAYEKETVSWGGSVFGYDTENGNRLTVMKKLQKRFSRFLLRKVGLIPQFVTILQLDENSKISVVRRKLNARSLQKFANEHTVDGSFIIVPDHRRWLISDSFPMSTVFVETKYMQTYNFERTGA